MTDNSKKVSELPTAANVALTDRVMVLRDPSGTPSVRTITVNNFINSISSAMDLSLPYANSSTAGVVKVGNNLSINATGHLNATYFADIDVDLTDVSTNIIPASDNTYSLGNSTHQWKSLYVTSNTIYIGGTPLTIDNTGTLLVNNSTVSGGLSAAFDPFTADANGQIFLSSTYYAEGADQGSADFVDEGVVLTRSNQGGLFNAILDYPSPQGTLWNSDGWDDLTNVQNRKYITFFASANGKLGVNVINKYFIMKDTVNNKYYKIQFTVWQQGGGGNFTYTRQQINGVTGANIGSPVTFAKTGSGQHDDIDTDISITRNTNQGIYNVSLEGGWNNTQPDSPTNTEWNSDGWQDLSNVKNRNYTTLLNCSGRYGYLHGQELIMHDTANDKYYTFKFSGWQAGGLGGAFSYERKLINTDVFFYREDGADNTVVANVDHIAPGISFARGNGGIIYNAEAEEGWNSDYSPQGTMWNADGWDDLSDITTRQYVTLWSTFKGATGISILDQDYVMHDTINDEYWLIKFTRWQQGSNVGGPAYPGFAYIRRKLKKEQQASGVTFADGTIQNKAVVPLDLGVLSQKKMTTVRRYLTREDVGKHVYVDNQNDNWISIADASKIPMPLGATITIVNRNGGSVYIYKENDYEIGNIFYSGSSRGDTGWTINDFGGGNVITLKKTADYWNSDTNQKVVEWIMTVDGVKNIVSNGSVVTIRPGDSYNNLLTIEPTGDYDIHLYESNTNGAVTLGRYGATNFRVYGAGGANNGGGQYGNDIRAELAANSTFLIRTYDTASHDWTFNPDGQFVLPQSNNGSLTAGFVTSSGNVVINADGNLWNFKSDGTLLSPYNVQISNTGFQLPANGDIKNSDGVSVIKSIPQNLQNTAFDYTLVASDAGKHIYKNDTNGNGVLVPTNASVAFEIGTTITIVSGESGWVHITPVDSEVTYIWGAGFNQTSTAWYIPQSSMATLLKIDTDKWMLSGAGLAID